MKMLARAPTKWFRTGFAVCLFLSVFLLAKPLTAEASRCHNASCGCPPKTCKNGVCWYSTWGSHCSGHNFVDAWGAAGNCTQDADIQAYCNLCETWYSLSGYPARQHKWGAWTPYNANSHISYCQNTSAQTISGLPGGRTVTIYNPCNATTTAPHDWSAVYDLKDGNQHAWKCTTCGYVYKQNHDWTDWQDNGDGRHVRKCTVCGRTEYGEHTYGDIKVESSQTSTHDKTVTYSFGCTTCPRVEHVKLTLHVSGVKEKGTESSRYKKSGQCPVSESAEYYTGTGTAEFWSGNNKSTDNKIVSQSVTVDENTGDRTSKNVNDKASGNTNTFTWNKDEGIKYFRYTVTDARGHTYSIATDYSYLLDHTPPQISVSVNLPGWVSGNRKNSIAWIENAATVKGRTSDSGESAWSNKAGNKAFANHIRTHIGAFCFLREFMLRYTLGLVLLRRYSGVCFIETVRWNFLLRRCSGVFFDVSPRMAGASVKGERMPVLTSPSPSFFI